MSTLVVIDKRLLVTYPSEAALEVLFEETSQLEILRELDGAFQSGSILEAGCQGELVARLAARIKLISNDEEVVELVEHPVAGEYIKGMIIFLIF
ncbi:9634_t:CDS:2 [Paraglomus brasilianum]|uniref:9634_t:CDS:1 n=1 Tax=Paraglomus brasilianum TaxID=144538 RepID=A0A9N9BG33_9GLOM|nr:9634_t:CDS:2 [Paraglomus brasilianum]